MKKILLILVSLVMLATPIQAGVIDITPDDFSLLDTTIIDCRSCSIEYFVDCYKSLVLKDGKSRLLPPG